ncbi:hypothetical protein CH286_02605 [Rhodococcus sp. WWJCD1]|nr:hypothetical protein CH286_02605 [Rhodococcus sp. WWJCD1]
MGEAPLRKIAKVFGISEGCLHRWLKIADRDDGIARSGAAAAGSDESAELRRARKRIKLLEHEAEFIRLSLPGRQPETNSPRKREVPPPLVLDPPADGVPSH